MIQNNFSPEYELRTEAYFEKIKKQIIKELEKAEVLVWISMAWLTDPLLINCLSNLQNKGVDVQIILDDNDKNISMEEKFNTTLIKKNNDWNMMHNKFCIIDLKTVINGSYNWTKNASYNDENIQITHDYETAMTFAKNFIKLKKDQ